MSSDQSWQPSASLAALRHRAEVLAGIRQYFSKQKVLEVETPVLSHFGGTDVHLDQWQTGNGMSLHTSPEFAMKRLLAAGSGDIFQICRVFRQDEIGQRHNPEFTMLEWYRVGIDEFALMSDVVGLIQSLSDTELAKPVVYTYSEAFQLSGLPHPLHSNDAEVRQRTESELSSDCRNWSRDECLDALMACIVEPALPKEELCFVHQYPASQAALAQCISTPDGLCARRFELYWQGMELANGYFELVDAAEQAYRFNAENQQRQQQGKSEVSQDKRFIAALEAGMPACSGVALGLDRLLMILLGKDHIHDVVAFPFDRA
ncbi:MAG: EF-P lysine aminoacylase EpmA [Reinekea sp.]